MRPVYMYVTNDKYQFPLFWADTVMELAQMMGVPPSYVSHGVRRNSERSRYKVVWIEDE